MDTKLDRRKTIVRWALAAVIVVDLGLVFVNWQIGRTPHARKANCRALNFSAR